MKSIDDYTQLGSYAEFLEALNAPCEHPVRFVHARESHIDHTRGVGCRDGVNIFGPGRQLVADRPKALTRRIESVIVDGGILMPISMTALDRDFGYLRFASENIVDPREIASYDPYYVVSDKVRLGVSSRLHSELSHVDGIGIPVCGPGLPNYGHFLYDGLGVALYHAIAAGGRIRIVGQPLQGWQKEILDLLDVAHLYRPITVPTRFKKLVLTTMQALHVSYPTRFSRSVFDFIRLKVGSSGSPTSSGERIFLTRGASTKRHMLNRSEVEKYFSGHGFQIVDPSQSTVAEQCRTFSKARFIAGEAGAGFANLGFVDPGAVILEVLPFNDQWTRGACLVNGHLWHAYFPQINADGSFTVDILDLDRAVRSVFTPHMSL